MKVVKSLLSLLKQYESWLDAGAILTWGYLLINYWLTGKLYTLIHPRYFGLTVATGISLLILGGWKLLQLWNIKKKPRLSRQSKKEVSLMKNQHINFFYPGLGSLLLLISALLALIITPQVFASQTALQRGLTESLPITRTQPQKFRSVTKPEERSLIEWIRTLNVYPEPDAYNLALKKLGLLPHDVIAIEDNLDGLKAAMSAELKCFAFPGRMQSEDIFKDRSSVTHDIFQSVFNIVNERLAA